MVAPEKIDGGKNAEHPVGRSALGFGDPVSASHGVGGAWWQWWGWVREVSRYQWLVLLVAWLGWVFDAMDGTIYAMVQKPVITDLLGPGASEADIGFYSSAVFSVMLIGWAFGGIVFGVLADYIGRTRALTITILIYSLFTGLSAFADNWWQLAIFRFITGLGLGGEWAAGAALVAEVWPDRLRARAGGILQSAAAIGFFLAALTNLFVGVHSWRYVFLVGALPALLVLLIRMVVKEPESWVKAKEERQRSNARAFTLTQLFARPLRRDTLVASALAFVVLLGLWGGTMWIPAAVREIAAASPEAASLTGEAAERYLVRQASYGVMLLNAGSLIGYLLFGPLADWIGRRGAFLLFFVGAVILFPVAFLTTSNVNVLFLLVPLVGIFTLGVTSGFPIYLPELFPTAVRTTGVGFCYNLGRFVTAGGVFITGYLVGAMGSYAKAATAVSLVYVVGMVVLVFARETRGQKLI
jgi:MFS family permease